MSLLIVLISYKSSADEYAIPLNKNDLAPFAGVLITNKQAEDYIKTKESLIACLERKTCEDNFNATDILIFVVSGFFLGSVATLAIIK